MNIKTALISASLLTLSAFARNDGLVDFGVAYYPEAWPEERWETDLRMMNGLGINLIRIGEFNWSKFEPTEGVFDFKPYLRLLDLCEKYGIKVMMCTPTAATPKWMQRDYPETEKTRADGTKPGPGIRQSSCASSEKFRFFSRRITEKMAEAFKGHPAVTTWQLDNELSVFGATGLCECERCRLGFVKYLQERFATLEALNKAFNGPFWSSDFTKWEDVRLPLSGMRGGWRTEYVRYQGERFRTYLLEQAAILRRANPKWRLTTNNPSASNIARHDLIYRDLGYASADTYCCWEDDNSVRFVDKAAWTWAMFRGLTGEQKPFMIGESGPFCFNADVPFGYDLLKPWFYLTLGFGAESFLYFRWRESVNGEETHPAILPWSGRQSFVYDQIKAQMDEYSSLPVSIARQPLDAGEVAIVHNAESHVYALTDAYACSWKGRPDYQFEVERNIHMALLRRGVKVDLVQMSDDMDLAKYKAVFFAQSFTVPDSVIGRLRDYVKAGGAAIAVNRFNFLDPRGFSIRAEVGPCGATDLFGIEIDDRRTLSYGDVEYAKLTTATAVGKLADTCFRGRPYVTRNAFGKGTAWYVTQVPTREMCRSLVGEIMPRIGVSLREELPDNVFRLTRGGCVILVNFTQNEQTVPAERGTCLMGACEAKDGRMTLSPFSVSVWTKQGEKK